ncbi:hypothetical protein HaLaN_00408, partial [Haematococcus lacustris]
MTCHDPNNDDSSASSEGWVLGRFSAGVAGCTKSDFGVFGQAGAAAGVAGQAGAAAREANRTKSATGVLALAKAAVWGDCKGKSTMTSWGSALAQWL